VVADSSKKKGESAGGIKLEGIEQMLHQTIARARRVIEQLASAA